MRSRPPTVTVAAILLVLLSLSDFPWLLAEISRKGRPAPLNATKRWIVERTNSWHNAHKKLLWCTERRGRVVDFWVALSDVVVIVRRLVREGWKHYRWEGRPRRRP